MRWISNIIADGTMMLTYGESQDVYDIHKFPDKYEMFWTSSLTKTKLVRRRTVSKEPCIKIFSEWHNLWWHLPTSELGFFGVHDAWIENYIFREVLYFKCGGHPAIVVEIWSQVDFFGLLMLSAVTMLSWISTGLSWLFILYLWFVLVHS